MINNQITTRILTDIEQFRACRSVWNELISDRLFHSWEWMFNWWEQYQDIGQLAIVTVSDSTGRLVGVAPWFKTESASRGRVVRSLGSGAACSDYVSCSVRPGYESVLAGKLVETMVGENQHELFRDVDLFEFEGHLRCDPVISLLVENMPGELADVDCEVCAGTWRVPLCESWNEFNSKLSKSFRRKTKKAIQRLSSDEFRGEVFWAPEDIERMWPVFVNLHQRRRQSLGQAGCFANKKFEAFLKAATLDLAASAKAQINMIFHENQPLTCNLEFTSGDSIYMYQTGMDPDRLNLEPGHITFAWAIRESINRQFRNFDFLRGDEPYKARWNAERIDLYRTRFIPNRFSSRMRHSILTTGKQMKTWAKSMSGRVRSN